MQVLPGVIRSPTSREAFRRMRAKWQNGAFATRMELGAAHTRVVYRAQHSTEAATYASTTSDTQSLSFAGTKAVRKLQRVAFRARKTVQGMKQSTTQTFLANGRDATVSFREQTTW